MRRSSSKFSKLPRDVRDELFRKLDDGWTYESIRVWLFDLKTDRDLPSFHLKQGDPFSLVWSRDSKDEVRTRKNFILAIGKWCRRYFPDWLKEQARRQDAVRLVERVEHLAADAGGAAKPGPSLGGTILVRSVLLDTIDAWRDGNKNPADIAKLANAWARMNSAGVQTERLAMQNQEAIDVGLEAIREELKHRPEALDAYYKFHAVVKGAEPTPLAPPA